LKGSAAGGAEDDEVHIVIVPDKESDEAETEDIR